MKMDESIKNIVVAAIRRHSMDISTWSKTYLWDEGNAEIKRDLWLTRALNANELPIHYSYISRDGGTHYCPFETGKASMGTIYAVMTLCQITPAA